MLSVAFARPAWRATLRSLRELTRLAVAALALTVGLNAATPASAPTPAAPASTVSSRALVGSPDSAPTADRLADTDVSIHPPTDEHSSVAPAADVVLPAAVATPAAEPGRRTPGRRGPPTA
ncbi:hypothetical protein [Micromonospora globbae]|uniref:hypothetical protein n=1 Tax=Micromonospora globbae TaxID=1894969 RepID=UPI003448B71B